MNTDELNIHEQKCYFVKYFKVTKTIMFIDFGYTVKTWMTKEEVLKLDPEKIYSIVKI
ncbi:hypothetical protein LJC17_01405 [Acholeplasma sp. OttesenSCG-928-E16]|nr:hypothetical protein [Acholeplasma sp. OttesenSCG-928-E16]